MKRKEELALVPSSGGLASALRELHERNDSCWVGWLGDTPKLDVRASRKLYRQAEASRLKPVLLGNRSLSRAYDDYANAVLWPLFHYLLDKVRLHTSDAEQASDGWAAYVEANKLFARAIAAEIGPFDEVWIHDYQLALVPGLLRRLVPQARIGFFLHIPWPSSDLFRILPSRQQILSGVLGADLVGFQTDDDRHNFLCSARDVLGAEISQEKVHWAERDVRVGVYPIGLDMERFAQRSADIDAGVAALRANTHGKVVVLSVDRLDYTKGVPQRLRAIDRLLENQPALRDRLHYIQLAVPTRESIGDYALLRRNVNELVARINSKFGSATSSPVQLLYRSMPFEQLIALYRAADVMLVTPLRDGMNLVAKEYVAARTDGRGCLVLSEFAGAAAELTSALHVNPYDVCALTEAIQRAMSMTEREQRVRMAELQRAVASQSVHKWAGDFLRDLSAAPGDDHTELDLLHPSNSRVRSTKAFRSNLPRSTKRISLPLAT